jgi:RND superfamily putative drug exporter
MVLFDFSKRRGAGRGPGGAAARSTFPALARWTSFVLRHRWLVLTGWVAILACGASLSFLLPGQLANSLSVPGTDAERAEAVLAHDFGRRPEGTFVVVFRVHHSSDMRLQERLRKRLGRAAEVLPGGQLGTFRAGAGVIYGELETTLNLQDAKPYTQRLRRALRVTPGPTALVSGEPAIQHDLDPQLAADLRRGEMLALPLATVVLAVLLGFSLTLAIPFLFAACTIAGTLALLYATAHLIAVSSYATNVVELIGLGLAVDYSLLVVCRYREEVEDDATRDDAIVRTMASAGRAVLFSGVAVAIGLGLLLLVPVPFIRTLGLAGLLIPLVAIVAALTLQPVLLSFIGVRRAARGGARPPFVRHREPWAALARAIMRRPVMVLLPTLAVLLAAAAPMVFLRVTPGSLSSLPRTTEATRGLEALTDAFGPGALTPTEIVVDAGTSGGARRPAVHAAVERLVDRLFHDGEVYVVATGRERPYVSADGRYARVLVVGRHEYGEPVSQRLITRIRETFVADAPFPAGTHVDVGGATAKGVDFLTRTYSFFPWLVVIVLGATYVVLARAFRSLLLPLTAVLMNLLSVAASYGLLVMIVRFGVGADLLGVPRSAEIEGWIPVFLFATLFGLSMDYEVFLVTRMREEWEARRDNVGAVAFGLERTGRVISAAALVMAVSFGGFVVGSVPALQQFGLGLALAVLIDATFVRVLLAPSLLAITGRWNWWLPGSLVRDRYPLERPRFEKACHEA